MIRSKGLSCVVYDTITDANGTKPTAHDPEIGDVSWLELAAGDVSVQSNGFTGLTDSDLQVGAKVNGIAPEDVKKISMRVSANSATDGIIEFPVFIFAEVAAGAVIPADVLVIKITGGIVKSLAIQATNGVTNGGFDNLTVSPLSVNLTHDAKTTDSTIVVEKFGNILKIYVAEEPETDLTVDFTDNADGVDFSGTVFGFVSSSLTVEEVSLEGITIEK